MADALKKIPKKGILKSSSSFDKTEPLRSSHKETKWDEMNILQTLHPADKDYGHMKIDEAKTPYSHYKDPEGSEGENCRPREPKSEDEADGFGLDADLLVRKIQLGSQSLPKVLDEKDEDDESSEDENLTEEEKAKKNYFEQKRKLHYNEFYAVKLARKLMEKEGGDDTIDDDDEEEEEEEDGGGGDDDEDGNVVEEDDDGQREVRGTADGCESKRNDVTLMNTNGP